MDIASIAITFILAALMLWLIVRLPFAIMNNLRAGHGFRDRLSKTLDELRLSRMLAFLGIDQAAYLHREQTVDIKRHMDRCDACEAKQRCDETLDKGGPAEAESLGFCANIDDLKNIRQPH